MLLMFTDVEGDPVAVESSAILAVRLGRVIGAEAHVARVTLISLPSCTVPVAEPIATVLEVWRAARESSPPRPAHPDAMGWLSQYFHPSALKPQEPPPWRAKPLGGGK